MKKNSKRHQKNKKTVFDTKPSTLSDAIKKLIRQKEKFIGHVFAGKYLDCGTIKGYINSSIEISKI